MSELQRNYGLRSYRRSPSPTRTSGTSQNITLPPESFYDSDRIATDLTDPIQAVGLDTRFQLTSYPKLLPNAASHLAHS